MFTLAEIVENRLYAVALTNEDDVFHHCFGRWQDVSYLYDFFKSRPII